MNLRTRARELFGRELSEHTVKATKVDHAVLRDLRKRATGIADEIDSPPAFRCDDGREDCLDSNVWERLAEDVWSEFYGDDEPTIRTRDKIKPEFHANRQLADKQARDESFRETRSLTRGHVTESALGLRGALRSLRKSYADELAKHAERQNEIADSQDHLDALDDMLAELRQQRTEAPGGERTVEAIDQKIRDLAQQKRAAVSSLREAVARQARHAGDLIDAAKTAVEKAADEGHEAVRAASLLPGREAGGDRRVSPDLMLELANRVQSSDVLKQVLEMMGRLELSMGSTRRQLRHGGYEEMVDIETGNDLRVVLPAEKMLLTHPTARLDFYRRFHERSLTQYEMWSEQELKRGPIIFAADGSGSMSGAPNVFCRGLTLASCAIGNREGRNAAAIEFGSEGELRTFFFPKEHPLDVGVALDFAEHFFGGGTHINGAIAHAAALIRDEEPFHSADLVIVTDGFDTLGPATYELRDELRAAGVKIHGLQIAAQPSPYLIEVCDQVTPVFDFAGPNTTSDRLAIDLS